MSIASIEARASALMSMHKEQLVRALAHFEHFTGTMFHEIEDKVNGLFTDDPLPTIRWVPDPVITDVPSAPIEPQPLDLNTLEPIPCAGANCGTTTADHSTECLAEHAAAIEGADAAPAPKPAKAAKKVKVAK